MEIFDAHTHLNDEPFRGQESVYLQRARDLDVTMISCCGQDPDFNRRAVALSKQFDNVYAMVGFCPDVAKDYDQAAEDEIAQQCAEAKTVAIGEIGLDYYWDESPRDVQRRVFARQLDLAHSLHIPVSIHTRDAFDDTYKILRDSQVGEYGGILHNFNGDPDWLTKFLDLGLTVSYSGVASFTKATDVHASVKQTPLDRMVIETDAPYLTPKPYRGKQNEPGYVRYVAEAVAKLKDLPVETIAQATYQNAMRIYGIKAD
ncbi:MAG: TatD family hydrolase [Lactobacillus sp.]|jgi:TatD DNase family protein|nr:TatD family hydrolase [Lactobacillus sp.]MCH3905813.1 TatD family hydrolase [Lactobacillus sp.]MCH3990606.1 TatD family hydrolase [Lactobacillus sp.]MCH4068678.1 TatD family hydrolase [Lactobacillus sp.]MCI1303837.1 TatD family hydrolase [Lactobacillus sp.]